MPYDDTTILDAYKIHLYAARRRPATILLRLGDLRRFQAATGIRAVDATTDDLLGYLAGLAETYSVATQAQYRCSFTRFYGWLHDTGRRPDNPAAKLPSIPKDRSRRHFPVPEDRLLDAWNAAGPRAQLALSLGAGVALRRSEIAGLAFADRSDRVLQVVGKGSKSREVPLDDLTHRLLLEVERDAEPGQTHYFPGSRGRSHVCGQTVYRWVKELVGVQYALHSLRRRGATQGFAQTHDIRAVQELLGHVSIETTQGYIRQGADAMTAVVDATSLARLVEPAPPRMRPAHELLAEVDALTADLAGHGWTLTLTRSTTKDAA